MAELWHSSPQAAWIQSPNNPTLSQTNPDVASWRRLDNAWKLHTHILDRPIKADVRMVARSAAEETIAEAHDSTKEGTTAAQKARKKGFITAAQKATEEGAIKAQEGKDDGILALGRGDRTAVENPICGISCLRDNAKRQRLLQDLDPEFPGSAVPAKGRKLLPWWEKNGRAKGCKSGKSNSNSIVMGIDWCLGTKNMRRNGTCTRG
ncbi:hypothetical protein NDU88_002064 [Pleurodeles waltl]|uniref:Uncharacterized protein n=1 Tax=Pleurodeles waltl TaxID=8319 RepID=A0AAV7KT48_PLEWA|nr:hypothetical protein NDU88_002064 [Pleurodeles waltl]